MSVLTPGVSQSLRVRQYIMHSLMLLSNAEGQNHGSGMSDGLVTLKSALPYYQRGLEWVDHLDPDRIWIGHVRSASRGTSVLTENAHPFVFENHGNRFTMIHNGSIYPYLDRSGDSDLTDTELAGIDLEDLLGGRDIKKHLLVEWMHMMDSRTSSSYIFYQGNVVSVLAMERPLFLMRVGDGVVVNTSNDVLKRMSLELSYFIGDVISTTEPVSIPPGTYLKMRGNIYNHHKVGKVDYLTNPLHREYCYQGGTGYVLPF